MMVPHTCTSFSGMLQALPSISLRFPVRCMLLNVTWYHTVTAWTCTVLQHVAWCGDQNLWTLLAKERSPTARDTISCLEG